MWQLIETYQYPTTELDFDFPKALFYSQRIGMVIGRCLLQDAEEQDYSFQYDCDGFSIDPTHWQPLPVPPPKEICDENY